MRGDSSFALAVMALTWLLHLQITDSRTVTIAVGASWPQHPASYLLEMSEFMHDQAPESFWQYAEAMCLSSSVVDASLTATDSSSSKLQSVALAAANHIVSSSMQPLMETMVGVGYYSPSVQFYSTMSEPFGNPCNGAAFAVVYPAEQIVCSTAADTLAAAVQTAPVTTAAARDIGDIDPESRRWDHSYPSAITPQSLSHKVVLYGVLGSSSFCTLHTAATALAVKGLARYSARHAFPGSTAAPSPGEGARLQGYGVFLDLKNMEYQNMDESESEDVSGDDKSAGTDADAPATGGGGAEDEEQSVDELPEVKKLKDLGLQTLASVARAADPMARLKDIVQGFPKAAPLLSKKRVAKGLRAEAQKVWQSGVGQVLPVNRWVEGGEEQRTNMGYEGSTST